MGAARENSTNPLYTKKQGQYLAFIHYYTKLHGQPLPNTKCSGISGQRRRQSITWSRLCMRVD